MKIDQIKMGSLLSYLSLILGTVVSLVYTPIMIERLGQSEYGVYSIVLPMVSYLNLFSFGLGSAYTRFYTRYKEANDKYNMAILRTRRTALISSLRKPHRPALLSRSTTSRVQTAVLFPQSALLQRCLP